MLLRYILGDDIFISYARADGITYATTLAEELSSMGFSCFLDLWGTVPGQQLPASLKRAIRRSTIFVLVGTEKAVSSHSVELEVQEFIKTKRPIVPIDFDGALDTAAWYSAITGLAKSIEKESALISNQPAAAVISRIEKSVNFTKRNKRIRRGAAIALTASALMFCGALSAIVVARQQRAQADLARHEAIKEQQKAQAAKAEADEASKQARLNADKATQQEAIAKENAAVAIKNAEQAKQQQAIAEENQATAFSRELASVSIAERARDPELSTLLSLHALDLSRTVQAEDALRLSLLNLRNHAIMRGHNDAVTSAKFSPDGQFVLTVSRDKTVRLWKTQTGEDVAILGGDSEPITGASFNSTGTSFVTFGTDKVARIRETSTGKCVIELIGHSEGIRNAIFSPNDQFVVTVSDDGTARSWDAGTGRQLGKFYGHVSISSQVAISPDNEVVLSGGDLLWELRTGRRIRELDLIGTEGVAFSPDGKTIVAAAVGGFGFSVKMFSVSTGKRLIEIADESFSARSATFSPDCKFVAITSSTDNSVQLWDLTSGKKFGQLIGHTSPVNYAEFSPDSKMIVTASNDWTARVWDVGSGKEITSLIGHRGPVNKAMFSADERSIVTASSDTTSRVWDLEPGKSDNQVIRHKDYVWNVAFSPDSRLLVTASQDNTAEVWDVVQGRSVVKLVGHAEPVNTAFFSSDGKRVFTFSNPYVYYGARPDSQRIWDTNTGQVLLVKSHYRDAAAARELSPDGLHRLRTNSDQAWVGDANTDKPESVLNRKSSAEFVNSEFSSDGILVFTVDAQFTVYVWPATIRGPVLAELAGHRGYINKMTISHNRKWILTASDDHTARVWDLASGKCLFELIGHTDEVWDADFSRDDKYVLTSSIDGTARVWDAKTGRLLYRLIDPRGAFLNATFSPDGTLIATAGSENTVKVWDTRTGKQISELLGHARKINKLLFSPDGKFIATASNDGTARIYPREMFMPLEENLKVANSRLTRDLTPDEKKKYLHLGAKSGQ